MCSIEISYLKPYSISNCMETAFNDQNEMNTISNIEHITF